MISVMAASMGGRDPYNASANMSIPNSGSTFTQGILIVRGRSDVHTSEPKHQSPCLIVKTPVDIFHSQIGISHSSSLQFNQDHLFRFSKSQSTLSSTSTGISTLSLAQLATRSPPLLTQPSSLALARPPLCTSPEPHQSFSSDSVILPV